MAEVSTNPNSAALVLTGSIDRSLHAQAVEAGASGVLQKFASLAEIIRAAGA